MKPFTTFTGIVAPLDALNVDTDQIIPKQFLKRVERTGFGEFLFFDWRFDERGKPRPEFVLNCDPYRRAEIMLCRANFGCGSSREHAPWAIQDFGFRALIAPSFADIFYNNCFQNGMLPIVLPAAEIDKLFTLVAAAKSPTMTVDLAAQTLAMPESNWRTSFDVEPFRKKCLLEGLDDIGLTLQHESKIQSYEDSPRAPRAIM